MQRPAPDSPTLTGTVEHPSSRAVDVTSLAGPATAPLALPVDALVDDVLAAVHRPVDSWAVAATLESFGLRDVDAGRYGERDIFTLALRVYADCRRRLAGEPADRPELTRLTRRAGLQRFVHFYARGTLFALPMVVQTLSVVLLGYALWSSLDFDVAEATAVSVGTIASFVVTGGFVQATGRLGRYYREQQAFLLAREVCWRLVRYGVVAVVVAGLALYGLDLLVHLLPRRLGVLALVYYALLSLLWLTLALLYTLERQLQIVACIVVGIAVIAAVRALTTLDITWAHWSGLVVTIAVAALLARREFDRSAEQTSDSSRLARLPRQSLLGYLVAPYYLYGVLYFCLLFLDRVVSWTAGRHPLAIWFDTPYEVGLDLALLSMVLTLAQLEYTIHAFSLQVGDVQKSFAGSDRAGHNRHFRRFYLRQVLLLAGLSLVSAPLVLALVTAAGSHLPAVREVVADPGTLEVFRAGAEGYALLVLALMNCVFFFSLSRVGLVLRSLGLALVVDLVVGLALSRTGKPHDAVFGLVAGCFVFALMTVLYGTRVLRRLDYYYYSAF